MDTTDEVERLLLDGQLDAAITLLNGEVRGRPMATEPRARLAELLSIAGNLERADVVLDAISTIDPGAAVGVALFRQLVRAEQARQQFFTEGRLPELVAKPDTVTELELRAAIALREGNTAEASARLLEREAARAPVAGLADGVPFDDFRDLDDLSAGHLEVLTPNGKYFWIPVASVTSIEFRKPERRRDLLWRRAHIQVTGGPEGEVYLPSTYFSPEATAHQRLGHQTDYVQEGNGAVLGRGLREYLVGNQTQTILELRKLEFSAQPASP